MQYTQSDGYFYVQVDPGEGNCAARCFLLLLENETMIRKLKSGEYRIYSRKKDPKTNKRKNLGTFKSRAAAEKHEHAIQYFKRH